jgi:uncharacterized membrane protein YedE/YeeE
MTMIDWNAFTPASALCGGLLIGLAASAFIVLNGRILGVSGIIANMFDRNSEQPWRLALLAGMTLAGVLTRLLVTAPTAETTDGQPITVLIAAGLLVGFGSRLGSGCASGHGICGLSRLSLRSLTATLTFMAAGMLVVTVIRHVV